MACRQPERLRAGLADTEAMDGHSAFGCGAQLGPQHAASADRVTLDRVFVFVLHPEEITTFDLALWVDGRGQRLQRFSHRRWRYARCLRGCSERSNDGARGMQLAGKAQISPLRLLGVVAQHPFGRNLLLNWRRGLSRRRKATDSCGKRRPSLLDHLPSARATRWADVMDRMVETCPAGSSLRLAEHLPTV